MKLPQALIDAVQSQKVVLVLGAGASLDSTNAKGENPPNGNGLKKLLADKFLGAAYDSDDLALVSAYAVNESDLFTVQSFIKQIFQDFQPSTAHMLLPEFRWAGLATTNYDLLVEESYRNCNLSVQTITPRIENGDKVLETQQDPNNIIFLKLHGCITRIQNVDCPLVLTRDQYSNYLQGRDRVFSNLKEWAYEHTLVFVGHGGSDPDLNQTIFDLEIPDIARPRHYMVKPSSHEVEKRYWLQEKKVHLLDGTFLDFMEELKRSIDPNFLRLNLRRNKQHSVADRFVVKNADVSPALEAYLNTYVYYVKDCVVEKHLPPMDFYRGYNGEWAPIDQGLDVDRSVTDALLEEVFLLDDLRAKKPFQMVILKGHAGSGKTVALRKAAWTAARDYDCLCVYIKDDAPIDVSSVQEIVEKCNERVFIFLDNAPDRAGEIRKLLREIGAHGDLVTLIIAARYHEWNSVSGDIQGAITAIYEVRFLSEKEIRSLLDLLEKHKALGRLESLSISERIDAFEIRAGRQLLVALHEATLGKLFEDILVDEYESLVPIEAQRIYLTICLLNRLEVPVRAGIISRIHKIPFSSFSKTLFKPLEHVVYASYDEKIRDYAYRARHPVIAEIVFEKILTNEDEKFEEYYRTLSALNIDFSTDETAFVRLIRGKTLLRLFSNQRHCEDILDLASDIARNDPRVMHQRAIYEMRKPSPDLQKSTSLLNEAIRIQPYYKPYIHTKSELAIRRADQARTPLEREKFLTEASTLARQSKDDRTGQTHAHHTLAKINIKRLQAEIDQGEKDFTSPTMQGIIKAVETEIATGLQEKPGDSYLLTERAKLARILSDSPKMILSLEQAFSSNPKLGYLAIQLADCYLSEGHPQKAEAVLDSALNANRTDKELNYKAGLLHLDKREDYGTAAYFLKRAFTPGDRSYSARLHYLRALFLSGDFPATRMEIEALSTLRWTPFVENTSPFTDDCIYSGRVTAVKHGFIFGVEDKSQISVMIPTSEIAGNPAIGVGSRIEFSIVFGFKGLRGRNSKVTG